MTALLAIYCIIIPGCGYRTVPVDEEKQMLATTLGIPSSWLEYKGQPSDPVFHQVRMWNIANPAIPKRPLGPSTSVAKIETWHGQISAYRRMLGMPDPNRTWMFHPAAAPLTANAATERAREITHRLWPQSLAVAGSLSVSASPHALSDGVRDIAAIEVRATVTNRPRGGLRRATMIFIVADGSCNSVFGNFWEDR